MRALIDGDLVVYRCAATVQEHEDIEIAYYRIDVQMQQILEATEAPEYTCYISSPDNFRKKINPDYKANRKDLIPPCYLKECKEYVLKNWNAVTLQWHEADDLLGINQDSETILCSLDKDLLMVPGLHYNWTKVEISEVTSIQGLKHFYKQMLIGDSSDNIFGVRGIGKVKAEKIISPLETEQEMYETVYNLYNQDAERFLMNANCLWILRKEFELWENRQDLVLSDHLKQLVDHGSLSMKSLNPTTSMGLGTNQTETSGIQHNGIGTDIMETSQVH